MGRIFCRSPLMAFCYALFPKMGTGRPTIYTNLRLKHQSRSAAPNNLATQLSEKETMTTLSLQEASQKVNEMIRAQHPTPEWACAIECQLGDKRADGLAVRMGFNPGWTVGYEVKLTRADFLREIKHPDKRNELFKATHEAYFIAPHGVLDVSELPEGWGWLEFTQSGLKVRHAPQQRTPENRLAGVYLLRHMKARQQTEPTTPKRLFKYMGRDLTESELLVIASEKVKALENKLRRDLEPALIKEIREREKAALDKTTAEAVGLLHYIQEHMQWRNASPEAVARVLEPLFQYGRLGLELEKTQKAIACLQDGVRLARELGVSHDKR